MKQIKVFLLSAFVAYFTCFSLPLHAEDGGFFLSPKGGKTNKGANIFSIGKGEDKHSAQKAADAGINAMTVEVERARAIDENRILKKAELALEKSRQESLLFKQRIEKEQAERQAAWDKARIDNREKTKQSLTVKPSVPTMQELQQKQAEARSSQNTKKSPPPPAVVEQKKTPRVDDGSVPGTTITPSNGSGRGVNDPIRLPR